MNCHMLLPLEALGTGDWADVADVSGEPQWVGRLGELGIRVGSRLQVLQSGCPCLVKIGGSRLSLRGADSGQILVQPLLQPA